MNVVIKQVIDLLNTQKYSRGLLTCHNLSCSVLKCVSISKNKHAVELYLIGSSWHSKVNQSSRQVDLKMPDINNRRINSLFNLSRYERFQCVSIDCFTI